MLSNSNAHYSNYPKVVITDSERENDRKMDEYKAQQVNQARDALVKRMRVMDMLKPQIAFKRSF